MCPREHLGAPERRSRWPDRREANAPAARADRDELHVLQDLRDPERTALLAREEHEPREPAPFVGAARERRHDVVEARIGARDERGAVDATVRLGPEHRGIGTPNGLGGAAEDLSSFSFAATSHGSCAPRGTDAPYAVLRTALRGT